MSMEVSNYLVSWVVTYLADLQPTYIGVIIYLLSLSTMDIPVYIGLFSDPLKNLPFWYLCCAICFDHKV